MNRDYKDPEYKAWCKKVYRRDKFKCVCCGKKGWLNAHHLNGWNWAVHERFDVNNGVTLCAGLGSCHNLFHDMYGKGNNNIYQFEAFLVMYNKTLDDIL